MSKNESKRSADPVILTVKLRQSEIDRGIGHKGVSEYKADAYVFHIDRAMQAVAITSRKPPFTCYTYPLSAVVCERVPEPEWVGEAKVEG